MEVTMGLTRLLPRHAGVLGIGATALALLLSGCGGESNSDASAALPGGETTVYLTAMEFKGSAEVSKEPFPSTGLPSGGGYVLKDPSGDPPKWEVEAYAWAPASFTVVEGSVVTLEIVGVNGAKHDVELEGHDQRTTIKRGEVATLTFTAGDAGMYRLVCHTHPPNMTAQMIVLPSSD